MKSIIRFFYLLVLIPMLGIGQTQIGSDIDDIISNSYSGYSVSLSADDGSVVAIGATQNSDNGESSGHVRVYKIISGDWAQVGEDIDGEDMHNNLGNSVSLSADGSMVAIGNIFGSVNGANSGQVQVYKNISGDWAQFGVDINGEAMYDQSGIGLSLSGDGSTLAIGAQFNSGNGTNAGHVRIFDISDVLSTTHFSQANNILYPNPATNVLLLKRQIRKIIKWRLSIN